MLKLKLQYFGHPVQRTDSFEKTLMLGKLEGRRRKDDREWDGWTASPTRWTWVRASFRSWWWTGKPGVLQSMGSQRVKHDWATELNWCIQIYSYIYIYMYLTSSLSIHPLTYIDSHLAKGFQRDICTHVYAALLTIAKVLAKYRSPGGGHGNPPQFSCLENPRDRRAGQATVHRVAKSRTQLKWLSRHKHLFDELS